jgi:phosphohistidine phosphatase SixA
MLLACAVSAATDETALHHALRSGGHVLLMRHAIAPGTGDPDRFKLGNCSTQRNLSQDGRDQARRIGARLRTLGVSDSRVYTSQWCRASETAHLLGLGKVSELPLLNSFFGDPARSEARTRSLRQWLARQDPSLTLVLVTHQVNITALTGAYPASGEVVVVRRSADGALSNIGSLRFD